MIKVGDHESDQR